VIEMHHEPRPAPPAPSPAPPASPAFPPFPTTAAVAEAAVERRLRRLGSRCALPAAAAAVAAGAIGWTAGRGGADWMASPPADSFLIALGGLLLVLLSSGVYGRILRRPAALEPGPDGGAGGEPPPPAAWAEERLSVYARATGIAFAMLAVAAGLGALVAITGRAPTYGLVISLASLLSMAARWPRRSGFDLALAAEAPPPPTGPDHGTG
jgi:hypothetical protein